MTTAPSLAKLFAADAEQLLRTLGPQPQAADLAPRLRGLLDTLPSRYAQPSPAAEREGRVRRVRQLVDAVAGGCVAALFGAFATAYTWPSGAPTGRPRRRLRGLLGASGEPEPVDAAPVPVPVSVDARAVLDAVRNALGKVDQVLADEQAARRRLPPRPWRDDRELVGLLRDLLAAGQLRSGQDALDRIDQLAKDLRLLHSIAAVTYDPADPTHGPELFDFPDGWDPASRTGLTTSQPALVSTARDGTSARPRVLVRGQIDFAPEPGPAPAAEQDT
ncbi:hypothetical protein [Phytohabitans suffuscus]